jgi:hypothetical protein
MKIGDVKLRNGGGETPPQINAHGPRPRQPSEGTRCASSTARRVTALMEHGRAQWCVSQIVALKFVSTLLAD